MVQTKTNIIYNSDVREVLKNYPDCYFDCIVSDVPYRIKTGGVRTTVEAALKHKNDPKGCLARVAIKDPLKARWFKPGCEFSENFIASGKLFKNCEIKFKEWLPEVFRVTKENSHVYFMVNDVNLKELWEEAEKVGFKFQTLLVWKKQNKTPNKYYMKQAEFILFMRKGKAKNINYMGVSTVFEIPNIIGNKKHPTEKPIELMESFIVQSTKQNDIVLDMFCGSGSTLCACAKTNRQYVGIDIDKKFTDIAQKRINELEVNKPAENNNNFVQLHWSF